MKYIENVYAAVNREVAVHIVFGEEEHHGAQGVRIGTDDIVENQNIVAGFQPWGGLAVIAIDSHVVAVTRLADYHYHKSGIGASYFCIDIV